MTKKCLFLLLWAAPFSLFAQSAFDDCDHIFKRVQHLPCLKISNEAFQDTLLTLLKSKGFPLKNTEIVYQFVVTTGSKIDEIKVTSGNAPDEEILQQTILQLVSLWKPAVQNGYDVCSYVNLKLMFKGKKVNIEISE